MMQTREINRKKTVFIRFFLCTMLCAWLVYGCVNIALADQAKYPDTLIASFLHLFMAHLAARKSGRIDAVFAFYA